MTLLEAIAEVLRRAEEPMHAKEITEQVLARGLWSTSGKTPEATVAARLYTDFKKKGAASAFVLVSPLGYSYSGLLLYTAIGSSSEIVRRKDSAYD